MADIYQTIFVVADGNNLDQLKKDVTDWHKSLAESGSLFVLLTHEYDKYNFLKSTFLDAIEVCLQADYSYINTIIVPRSDSAAAKGVLRNNVQYLMWFAKDIARLHFDKDAIREKHIWKDVEWGKRAKNYNPKGKDPGNVWIPTEDDGKGHITSHVLMDLGDIINRCLVSTADKQSAAHIHLPEGLEVPEDELPKDYKISFSSYKKLPSNIPQTPKTHRSQLKKHDATGQIIFASSEKMSKVRSGSVTLMITSPPYWDLKNYFKEGQIGQESYRQYLDRMEDVWRETYRALSNDGSMFINVNLRSKAGHPILIPQDIVKQCQKIGFKLRDIIIWHKSSGIPTHAKNIVSRHEYVLWFVKSPDYKFNSERVSEIRDYTNEDLNHGLLWNLNRKAGSVGHNFVHPAIYPLSLTDRIINLASGPGDSVLDPFLGSGTTLISALNHERDSINYEYNEDFDDLIKHRLLKEKVDIAKVKFVYPDKQHSGSKKVFR